MKAHALPEATYLRKCLRYYASTGKLFWKKRPRAHFVSLRAYRTWNARFAGTEAFHAIRISQRGGAWHCYGTLDYRHYFAHRIIWKIVTGQEPSAIVDHEDQDGTNNKWKNLREATKGQNNINAANPHRGIWFDKARNKWAASVHVARKQIHLGRFNSKEEALYARKIKAVELYGEFIP